MNDPPSKDSISATTAYHDDDEFQNLYKKLMDYHQSKVQGLLARISTLETKLSASSSSSSSSPQMDMKNVLKSIYTRSKDLLTIDENELRRMDPSNAILTITNQLVDNIQSKSMKMNESAESLEHYRLKYKKFKSQRTQKDMLVTSPSKRDNAIVSPDGRPRSPIFSSKTMFSETMIVKSPLIVKETLSKTPLRPNLPHSEPKKRILLEKFNAEDMQDYPIDQQEPVVKAHVKYNSVVRNRVERSMMHGISCSCCSSYYKAVHPTNFEKKIDSTSPINHCRSSNILIDRPSPSKQDAEESEVEKSENKAHQRRISRHRYIHIPPSTPPGYWDVCFTPPM